MNVSHKTSVKFRELQNAIFALKQTFEQQLSLSLNLTKVQAPLYLNVRSGLNDNLNGVELPVQFSMNRNNTEHYEVVQSLAKWKRFLLGHEHFAVGEGIYTDMRALRPSDDVDSTHSIYVDQWDWERVISPEQRTVSFLKDVVSKIYRAIYFTNSQVAQPLNLPNEIAFIHAQDLYDLYPNCTPKERETRYAKEKGAIFIIGVGGALTHGEPHDLRAPDYDDWTTEGESNRKGLNGDIIIYSPELEIGLEVSSMGIRVNQESLLHQLELTKRLERKTLPFHSKLLNGQLPLSIGGGVGQSRLAMLLLRKSEVTDVQAELFEP